MTHFIFLLLVIFSQMLYGCAPKFLEKEPEEVKLRLTEPSRFQVYGERADKKDFSAPQEPVVPVTVPAPPEVVKPVIDKFKYREMVFFFDFNESETELNNLQLHAFFMKNNLQLKMILHGHTDQIGNQEYNLSLSERRAEFVKNSLLMLGVDENRMEVVAHGEMDLVLDLDNFEELLAKDKDMTIKMLSPNRRVEIEYTYR